MSSLLEILGRGLLTELSTAFRVPLREDADLPTPQLQRLVQQDPHCPEQHRRLGLRLLAERCWSPAREQFLETLRLDPHDRVARLGLACALDELGQTREAIRHLGADHEHNPDDGSTLFALGFCHEKIGDTDAAIKCYEDTLEVAGQIRNAHERLAAIYLRLDNVPMAIRQYEHLCWCEPGDVAAALTLANLHLRAGNHEEAVRRFEFALTIDPDNWDAQDDLVSAYVQAGRHDEAVAALQQLIEQRPECADQHLRLGELFEATSQHDLARQSYACAVQLNPDYLQATIKLGTALLREGSMTEAAQLFARAIEINDRILEGYVGLGVAQQAAGATEDALATFEMAAGIEPNSVLLFAEMARLQLQTAAAQQAQRYVSPQAVMAHPLGPPHAHVEDLIARQVHHLRNALRQFPNHADLNYRLGLLLRHAGDLAGAITAYRSAVAINPNYVKALTKLGICLRESGRVDEAIATFTQALHADAQSVDLHYQLGLLYADHSEFSLALEQFERRLEHDPHHVATLANLALCLQDMGLLDRAAATWMALTDLPRHAAEDAAPTAACHSQRRTMSP